jgi:tRNA 2-thiouridine synthesizing protein A
MEITVSVDARGLKCPKPLTETRKQLNKMQEGEIVEVLFDHEISYEELPKAINESGDTVLELIDLPDGGWKIIIKKTGD